MDELAFTMEMLEQDLIMELSSELKNRAFNRAELRAKQANLRNMRPGSKNDKERFSGNADEMNKRVNQMKTFAHGMSRDQRPDDTADRIFNQEHELKRNQRVLRRNF